ncbi:MAG: type III-B CRISPR module RAMP protein Cmr1 [Anaerolineae bacterium]|nr:type III-B CRISPR module RAMP protein Cmr1 [Anaerolineae bacterium]
MLQTTTVTLRTLTPLWTGGADRTCDRVHATGIIGSLRWWYEALIRGLGGYACDPVAREDRCVFDSEAYERGRRAGEPRDTAVARGLRDVCPACRLFGCTGWARKLRIEPAGSVAAGQVLQLTLRELRPLDEAEAWLLVKTIWLVATYGAIGGRTTLKPDGPSRASRDYGLVQVLDLPSVPGTLAAARQWVRQNTPPNKTNRREWPNMRYFFFASGAYLNRTAINDLMGLSHHGRQIRHGPVEKALRGRRGTPSAAAVSKKVFSFAAPDEGGRIWGYVPDASVLSQTIDRLQALGVPRSLVRTGEEVLNAL